MTSKKQPVKEEPFLNTVARKLGYAAGTFTNVAQELTENLSTLPKAVSTKVRSTAGTALACGVVVNSPRRKPARPLAHRGRRSP